MILKLNLPTKEIIYIETRSIVSLQDAGNGHTLVQLDGGVVPYTVLGNVEDLSKFMDRGHNAYTEGVRKVTEETKQQGIWAGLIGLVLLSFTFSVGYCSLATDKAKLLACQEIMTSPNTPAPVKRSLLDQGNCRVAR